MHQTQVVTNRSFSGRVEDPAEALKAFENGLLVSLISTPRDKIKTCRANEVVAAVVAGNRADQFDFLPVIEPLSGTGDAPDRIIGLIEVGLFLDTGTIPEGLVRDHMRAL